MSLYIYNVPIYINAPQKSDAIYGNVTVSNTTRRARVCCLWTEHRLYIILHVIHELCMCVCIPWGTVADVNIIGSAASLPRETALCTSFGKCVCKLQRSKANPPPFSPYLSILPRTLTHLPPPNYRRHSKSNRWK